jgi:hypothetical protein
MCGTVPVQDFPRTIIEHHLYPLDRGTGHMSKPCAPGKELAQQTIGVLVRPALPRGMGVDEDFVAVRRAHPSIVQELHESDRANTGPLRGY